MFDLDIVVMVETSVGQLVQLDVGDGTVVVVVDLDGQVHWNLEQFEELAHVEGLSHSL